MTRAFGSVRAIAIALCLAAAALSVPACTHDFASFEPESSDLVESEAGADAPASPADASRPDVTSAVDAADAACSNAPACAATGKTCSTTCDQTRDTCRSKCNNSNTCRRKCDDDRNECRDGCGDTCKKCAGTACLSACK